MYPDEKVICIDKKYLFNSEYFSLLRVLYPDRIIIHQNCISLIIVCLGTDNGIVLKIVTGTLKTNTVQQETFIDSDISKSPGLA
jgi:hypothetical protein